MEKGKFNRVIIAVFDGMGIGSLPDAKKYGDINKSCLDDVMEKENGAFIPNLLNLGLINLSDYFKKTTKVTKLTGCYSKIRMKSCFKDSWAGHWEIAGVDVQNDYSQYCDKGFSDEIIQKFEKATGLKVLGNEAILHREEAINKVLDIHKKDKKSVIVLTEKGKETIRTFCIYISKDNMSLEEQYDLCKKTTEILKNTPGIQRIGARPIEISNDNWIVPHPDRKDFLMFDAPDNTILQKLSEKKIGVYTTGKVSAMFRGKGIKEDNYARTNDEVHSQMIKYLDEVSNGLIFGTYNDMDCMFATAKDTKSWKKSLEDLDIKISEITTKMKSDDLLIICADGHGADPVYTGLHTREYSPLLVYSKKIKNTKHLDNVMYLSDIAATIADNFEIKDFNNGNSFLNQLL